VRASAKIDGHDHQLREALAIAETLAREGKLTAAQQGWPRAMRDMLAKLPPQQAGAQ
jgi:hypothetical protein